MPPTVTNLGAIGARGPGLPPWRPRSNATASPDLRASFSPLCFEDLLRVLKKRPDLPTTCDTLKSFIDQEDFFEKFLYAKDRRAVLFRTRLFLQNERFCEEALGPDAWSCFVRYMRGKYKTLDGLQSDGVLARSLGIWDNTPRCYASRRRVARRLICYAADIAKKCVDLGIFERQIPSNHTFNGTNRRSFYLMPEVVDVAAAANREVFLKSLFPNLDAVKKESVSKVVLRLLGLTRKTEVAEVAKALVDQGILSAGIPANHIHNGSRISHYFQARVVGSETSVENMKKYSQACYPNLDRVERDGCFSAALGLSNRQTVRDLARKLVEMGWLSPTIPENHPLTADRTHSSSYFDPDVVCSREKAIANLVDWVKLNIKAPGDISQPAVLSVLLQKLHPGGALAESGNGADCKTTCSKQKVFDDLLRLGWIAG